MRRNRRHPAALRGHFRRHHCANDLRAQLVVAFPTLFRLVGFLLAAVAVAACSVDPPGPVAASPTLGSTPATSTVPPGREPTPRPTAPEGTVALAVSGSGTFDCGHGFHGCSAWLAIRPADWQATDGWAPDTTDRDFRPRSSPNDMSIWLVSGSGVGGPDHLLPGDYRFVAAITEFNDVAPGVLGTLVPCDQLVTVPEGAAELVAHVAFGPKCSIETMPVLP